MQSRKSASAALFLVFAWSLPATAIDTPKASLYHALIDVCLDRYLSDQDLNTAQSNTGRPLIVHCDCIARFLFSYMDDEAIRQLETRVPDKISANWGDAVERCTALIVR